MECPICLSEFAPNTGIVCSSCGNRVCQTCYDMIRNNYKCPTCRTEYRPFILGQIPPTPVVTNNRTNPIVQNHYNRCHGKYAGGSKNCTYQPTHQVGALAYCSRCCKIRLRLPRNTTPPNEYLIH